MTLPEKLALALGIFLLACVFVLWAMLALEDNSWQKAEDQRQKPRPPESLDLREVTWDWIAPYSSPLSGGRERSKRHRA